MTPNRPIGMGERASDLRAYAMLTLAFLFLALNVVIGRAVHEFMPPVAMSFWRWAVAGLLFLPFSLRHVHAQWPLIAANWKLLVFMSAILILVGNTLVYVGLQSTTALNAGLIPVSRPMIILIMAWLLFRGMVRPNQWAGVLMGVVGVVLVITRGDPEVLTAVRFNRGDLWIVASSFGISTYQVLVGRVPREIRPEVLAQATMVVGSLCLLPVYVWESAAIRTMPATFEVAGIILYLAIFPTILSVLMINGGVKAVGPARAGIFNFLQPLMVAAISIPLLDEVMEWYHPVALALVAAGIAVSSRRGGSHSK